MQCVLLQCVSLMVISRGVSFAIIVVTEQHLGHMITGKIVARVTPVTSHLLLHPMPVAL